MNRTEILPRVPGNEIPASYALGRCEAEGWRRQLGGGAGWDGNWVKVRGCDLAFFFRLPSGKRNADVVCPGCGLNLEWTTRRLRAGFLPLSAADVKAILASKGQPVEVSCLSPIVAAPVAPVAVAPAPAAVKSPKLDAAVAALAAFDAKPRCEVCWGYNASVKTSPRCSFCREWKQTTVDQTAQGERNQYTWKRSDLVARVKKYGGTPAPAPVLGI
jgi:hypothetical protein